jgi:hypothetical protein
MTKTTTFRVLLGLTGLMLLALPSTSHAARAVSAHSPPEVYDTTAPRPAERTGAQRCYEEPKGFRNNIHFNPPCATAPRDAHPPMPGARNEETGGNHNHS